MGSGDSFARMSESYLRDTLLVLAAVEDGPGDAAGVLALEEEGLGFAILEAEDLAVATDVKFTLQTKDFSSAYCLLPMIPSIPSLRASFGCPLHS